MDADVVELNVNNPHNHHPSDREEEIEEFKDTLRKFVRGSFRSVKNIFKDVASDER